MIWTTCSIILRTHTWVPRRNGRRDPPMFAQEMWSMNARTWNHLPRTNNNVEGWHRRLQFHINAYHPNIWKFLNVIKREESLTKVKANQCLGEIPVPGNKRYADCNTHIVNIVQNYPGMQSLDYLRRIAYNLLQKWTEHSLAIFSFHF